MKGDKMSTEILNAKSVTKGNRNNNFSEKNGKISPVRMLTMTAALAAVACVLAFFEFPVPLSPSFARMDLSDYPALIGAFAFGPLCGILVELVKNALQLLSSSTGGVGELANFLMGGSYVAAAGFIYKYKKTKYLTTNQNQKQGIMILYKNSEFSESCI